MSDLRFYSFVNYYLSSIQQGVQSFHVLHEMFNKYDEQRSDKWNTQAEVDAACRLFEWSKNHTTLIILNGGAHADIDETYSKLFNLAPKLSFPMPFDKFHEDVKSLGGIITACGCVLPQEIYEAADYRKACQILGNGFMVHVDPLCFGGEDAYFFIDKSGEKPQAKHMFKFGTPEHELITLLKSCSLAR